MSTHQNVSFDDEPLILVDPDDRILGYDNKRNVHLGPGALHRAFSVFLFAEDGRVLLQQRSREKPLWPLFWSNSCCSHPRKGETYLGAAHRRLAEELALEAELTFVYQFQYQADYRGLGAENELCAVFIGRLAGAGKVDVNPSEVAAWRWAPCREIDRMMADRPEELTPWFLLEWHRLRQEFGHLLNEYCYGQAIQDRPEHDGRGIG